MAELRAAVAEDWKAFSDWPAPDHWIGLTCVSGGKFFGMGGIFEAVDGRWWAVVKRAPGVRRPVALVRAAREVLDCAGRAGVPVHAIADSDISGSERFLAHLGFVATDEVLEQHRVWKWQR